MVYYGGHWKGGWTATMHSRGLCWWVHNISCSCFQRRAQGWSVIVWWPFNFEAAETKGSMPKLHLNPYTWSKVSNMIYLDSPAGVGFSYSGNTIDYTTGDLKTASDTHTFLLKFQLPIAFLNIYCQLLGMYQVLDGVIEQRILEPLLHQHKIVLSPTITMLSRGRKIHKFSNEELVRKLTTTEHELASTQLMLKETRYEMASMKTFLKTKFGYNGGS